MIINELLSDIMKKSFIFDIDGVIWIGDHPAEGSIESIRIIRQNVKKICLLSNDAVSSRISRIDELNQSGFSFNLNETFTASFLVAEYVKKKGNPKTLILGGGEGLTEFRNMEVSRTSPEIVIVTDFFDCYNKSLLQDAFCALRNGAELVVAQKNKFWNFSNEEIIDVGFWVAGLEYCCSVEPKIIGKPSEFSYLTCLRYLESNPIDTIMISDDSDSDLRGAKELGIWTIHISQKYNKLVQNPIDNVDLGSPNLIDVINLLINGFKND